MIFLSRNLKTIMVGVIVVGCFLVGCGMIHDHDGKRRGIGLGDIGSQRVDHDRRSIINKTKDNGDWLENHRIEMDLVKK